MAEDNTQDGMSIFEDVPAIDITDENPLFLEDETIEEEQEEIQQLEETGEEVTPESVASEQSDEEEGAQAPAEEQDSSPNLFSSLAALLQEKGLISSESSEVENEEAFVELFRNEIKKNEFSDLTENQRKYLEGLRAGIPQVEVETHIAQTDQLNNITEAQISEDANLRQSIIYTDLVNRGFSKERAQKMLQRSIELEADTEDAKEALESIKRHVSTQYEQRQADLKKQRKDAEAAEVQRVENIKKAIKSSKQIIENFPLTDNVKEKMEENMFKIIGESPEGREENALMKYARENKQDFDMKLYYLFTITKGFSDFSVIEKTKNTKIVRDLEKAMRSTTRIKEGSDSPVRIQDPDSYIIDIEGHDLVL